MKTKQITSIVTTGFLLSLGVGAYFATPALAAEGAPCEAAILSCEGGIDGMLDLALGIATAGLVGLTIAGVAYGIILYTTAGGSDGIKKAKTVFINIAIGIIVFGAMAAFLAWMGIDSDASGGSPTVNGGSGNSTGGGLEGAGSAPPPRAPPGRVIPY